MVSRGKIFCIFSLLLIFKYPLSLPPPRVLRLILRQESHAWIFQFFPNVNSSQLIHYACKAHTHCEHFPVEIFLTALDTWTSSFKFIFLSVRYLRSCVLLSATRKRPQKHRRDARQCKLFYSFFSVLSFSIFSSSVPCRPPFTHACVCFFYMNNSDLY